MSAFEERYALLNPEQKEAVDTLGGPVMVIAGPGTGKTEILTMRIANLLREQKAPAEKILALTFTESGAVSMRRRLAELIGAEAYRVEISTFHGFANRIIRDYPDYFPDIVGSVSITEIDQVDIVRRLIDTLDILKLRPFGDTYYYLRDILHALGELKQQGVSPEAFAALAAREKEEFYANPDLYNTSGKYEGKMKGKYDAGAKRIEKNLELAGVYDAYQKALRKAKQYDYSDMIMYVAIALEKNEDLRRVLQDAYDYFLVDEHQDTNDAQNKIIELLADGESSSVSSLSPSVMPAEAGTRASSSSPSSSRRRGPSVEKEELDSRLRGNDEKRVTSSVGPNLFVVGDEKQAIFRFQGASLENFHYFKNRYKNVKLISLRANYRSTQAILNAAQGVSPREAELVARAGHEESPANLAALSTPDAEYYFVARKIEELIKAGVLPEEIAILYRDNKDAAPLARMLEKLRVPFNIESDQDVLGDLEIKNLVRILRAVQHFGNDVWLSEALHVDFLDVPPIDAYKLMSFAGKNRGKIKIYDILRSEPLQVEAKIESKEACLALFNNLSRWKRAAENQGAGEAFEMIVRDSGFLAAILRNPSGSEKLAKLHALFDLLKSFIERQKNYTLHDFFAYLDLMEEHGLAIKSKDTVRLPGRVRLMTAHRSKGMEFEYVFIINAVDRKWGSRFHRESLTLPPSIYHVLAAASVVPSSLSSSLRKQGPSSNNGEKLDFRRSLSRTPIRDGNDEEKSKEPETDQNADERNVFYVALTRARKELFITMSKTDREGKEQLPTQFIAELKENILVPYDVTPYEADFAAHRADIEFAEPVAKNPELEDKEFLNALFEAQGISVTGLNNYLKCPWAYFYRNLVRIPEAPNKNLSFGNAVHAALKSYFDALGEGEDKGKNYLVQRFEEALAHEPIKETEYEEALAKGQKGLPAFYDEYHGEWSPRAVNEAKIEGITLADGTKINGKLDRIEFLKDPAVRVIDYKTGKPKTRNDVEGKTQSSDGDYKRQMVFYKLLLDKEGKHDMRQGVIQFIESDDRGKLHREEFDIMPAEVTELEKQVQTIAQEIRDLSFWSKGCNEKDCRYCELRREMA